MPPRKKARKTETRNDRAPEPVQQVARRNVRGRRGGLKDMPGMPLDILIEIFGFMHPRDLLTLARTSKSFRALLMSRSSQAFWKASIEGVDGLPKCPPYLSEPAYVNLLFFPHCHGCLKPNVQTVLFEFSARYCNGCKSKMLAQSHDMYDIFTRIRAVTKAGAIEQPFANITEGHRIRWHKPEVDAFCAQWDSLPDEDSKKVLLKTHVLRTNMMLEALPALRQWRDNQKSKRSVELHQIKVDRFESIKTKLREEGWTEELNLMNNWQLRLMRNKFASKAESLTERAWQKIRDSAVGYMQDIKNRRLEAVRRVVLQDRFERFAKAYETYRGEGYRRTAESDLEPYLMDLAVMHEFREVLDVPEDADMSILDNEEEMRTKFDAAILRWCIDRKTELTNMVTQSTQVYIPEGADPLALSCALFACRVCGHADLRYPAVIAHVCNRVVHCERELYARTVAEYWSPQRSRSPWSPRYLSLSTNAMAALPPILKACGLNPMGVTLKEMDECVARLKCKGCPEAVRAGFGGLKVSSYTHHAYTCWTALDRALTMKQCLPRGKPPGEHSWVRLSKKEEKVIKKLEDDPTASRGAVDVSKWLHGCHYCDYSGRPRQMTHHLSIRHGITVDVEGVGAHAYRHHDGKPKQNNLYLHHHDNGSVSAEYYSITTLHDWDLSTDYDYDSDNGLDLGDIDPDIWESYMDYDSDDF